MPSNRPSKRIAVHFSLLAVLAAGPAGWAAQPHGVANGHQGSGSPTVTPFASYTPPIACRPDWTSCSSSGAATAATGAIAVSVGIRRDKAGTGTDEYDNKAWAGQSFVLPRHVKSVTATVVLDGITPGSAVATSADGGAIAEEWAGASITDSACADFGCGNTASWVYSNVRTLGQAAGATTKDTTDTTRTRTFSVTMSMPDGSDLPVGTVYVAGVVFARVTLDPLSCIDPGTAPQTCTTGTPHTGSVLAGLSATTSRVSFTLT